MCNLKKKKKTERQSTIRSFFRKERWLLNFRGVQFKLYLFFPSLGRARFCFCSPMLCFTYGNNSGSLVLRGSLKQVLKDSKGFLSCFLLFPPRKIWKMTVGQGLLTGSLESYKFCLCGWGEDEMTETCCSSKKKKRWP